jgi:hypothetical protein
MSQIDRMAKIRLLVQVSGVGNSQKRKIMNETYLQISYFLSNPAMTFKPLLSIFFLTNLHQPEFFKLLVLLAMLPLLVIKE